MAASYPMHGLSADAGCDTARLCAHCSIPVDAKIFDESGVADAPTSGHSVVLARFDLSPQYCGVLQFFSQFTDFQARDHSQILTPGLLWSLRINQRPFYPYLEMDHIVNPWGFGSFQIALRLEERASVDFLVRAVSGRAPDPNLKIVAGRIFGRYWYNAAYGDVEHRRA